MKSKKEKEKSRIQIDKEMKKSILERMLFFCYNNIYLREGRNILSKTGFTIGKFAPLHKGHQYLIETAIKEMDEVYVVVYETDLIDIPVEQRADWIRKLYPSVNVIIAKNPPKQYGMDEESVKIQID